MKDLRSVLNQKHKSLLVINAINRDQLTAHFDVSICSFMDVKYIILEHVCTYLYWWVFERSCSLLHDESPTGPGITGNAVWPLMN